MDTTTCERVGCEERVPTFGVAHSYCERHAADAIVEEVRELGRNVIRLTERVDALTKAVKGVDSVVTDIAKHQGALY